MNQSFETIGGIIVPRGYKKENPKCKSPIPMSILQHISNTIFYSRDDQPLNLIGTLSSEDTLLARAAAYENISSPSPKKEIHEIGPGNFNFARTFVDSSSDLERLVYTGHDFSDAQYAYVKEQIAKYGEKILFKKSGIEEFSQNVTKDNFTLYLVEVLDDTLTEFFTLHQGQEMTLCSTPEITHDELIPTRAKFASEQAMKGDFSKQVQRMAQPIDSFKNYTPQEVIHLMETLNIPEMLKLHPGFLRNLGYDIKQAIPIPLEQLAQMSWRNMPADFEEYRKKIFDFFRKQLGECEDKRFIHLPISGINLLYHLKNRKDISIHFFDYGYATPAEKVSPFSIYNGQITAPVNFGVLEHAANLFGFKVLLEKNRDYIKRNLGHDTIPIGYLLKALKDTQNPNLKKVLFEAFNKHVKQLQPDITCTPDNILNFRIPRIEYEKFMQAAKESELVNRDFEMSEGSYHMNVYK